MCCWGTNFYPYRRHYGNAWKLSGTVWSVNRHLSYMGGIRLNMFFACPFFCNFMTLEPSWKWWAANIISIISFSIRSACKNANIKVSQISNKEQALSAKEKMQAQTIQPQSSSDENCAKYAKQQQLPTSWSGVGKFFCLWAVMKHPYVSIWPHSLDIY